MKIDLVFFLHSIILFFEYFTYSIFFSSFYSFILPHIYFYFLFDLRKRFIKKRNCDIKSGFSILLKELCKLLDSIKKKKYVFQIYY